jgi:transposase
VLPIVCEDQIQILGEFTPKFDVHPNQIKQCQHKCLADVGDIFSGETKSPSTDTPVDVKTLHAKIGELTLENDF